MGFRLALKVAWRFPCRALIFAFAAGCSATVPGAIVQNGSSQDSSVQRPTHERSPRPPLAFLTAPVIEPQDSTMPNVVTVDYRYPTVQQDLPQPKPLPA